MVNLDDLKTGLVASGGIGHHWLLDLDLAMSLAVTVASLVYVVLKIRLILRKGK